LIILFFSFSLRTYHYGENNDYSGGISNFRLVPLENPHGRAGNNLILPHTTPGIEPGLHW